MIIYPEIYYIKNHRKSQKFEFAPYYIFQGPIFHNPLGTSKSLNVKDQLFSIVQQ